MRPFITILLAVCSFFYSFGQATDSLALLLRQGVALHDKNDFEGAIRIYDSVLKRDPSVYLAWYEKSLTLYTAGKYQDCIDMCKEALKRFPKEEENRKLYANYGSALDALDKPREAIDIYSEGIKKFPNAYLLYFNRGITEYLQKDIDKATIDLEKSVSLNPVHASSHLFLAQCMHQTNKIAAIMSLCTFLLLEPEGKRAVQAFRGLSELAGFNVKQKDEKNIEINLSPGILDTKSKKPDDFHSTEFLLSLQTANDMGERKSLNIAEKLSKKLEVIAEISTDGKKSKQGFFTTFYIPFFKQMQKDSLLLTAAYIIHTSSDNEVIKNWLQENKSKVDDFYKWLDAYVWIKEDK